MTIDRRKYLYRIKRLEIKSWMKYLMLQGKEVIDYVLGELTTGTNITINNTVEKTFYKFDIKGNSTQETTTGKNLYDVSSLPVTAYGITISRNENGDIVLNGTPDYTSSYRTFSIGVGKELETGTYTVSVANKKDGIGLNVGGFGGQLNLTMSDTVKTKTVTSTQAYTIAPQINIRYDVGTLTNFVLNPMLEKSASATTYEPYTGGIASPNPSYPQPILSAGDNNSISEKIENSDGTKSQTYTIPCQQPMRSIGTVRDEFIKVNGEWKERHKIYRYTFTGNETGIYKELVGTNMYVWRLSVRYLVNNDSVQIKSNYFTGVSYNNRTSSSTNIIYCDTNGTRINFRNTDFETLEDFKTFLSNKYASGNPVYIDYVLETPTDLSCTEEQIAILENLPKSYDEQTNIYSLDVTPAYVEAQAYVKKDEE